MFHGRNLQSLRFASVSGVPYDHNLRSKLVLALAKIVRYAVNRNFIVLATVVTIVNYDCNTFKLRPQETKL